MEEGKNNLLLEISKLVFSHNFGKILDYFWDLNIWGKLLPSIVLISCYLFSKKKKIKELIIKSWKYLTSVFYNIKKEILLFQSKEDNEVSWVNEVYIERKFGFCSLCQGGNILYKDKIRKILFLTLRLVKIRVGNKTAKKSVINRFCRSCSKRKVGDLENNPTLKNPKKLKIVKSWYYPTK